MREVPNTDTFTVMHGKDTPWPPGPCAHWLTVWGDPLLLQTSDCCGRLPFLEQVLMLLAGMDPKMNAIKDGFVWGFFSPGAVSF